MSVRSFAKQIVDAHGFTYQNLWTPRDDSYRIRVDLRVWQAVYEQVCAADMATQATLASGEVFNSGYMATLGAQLSEVAPRFPMSCLQAAAVLAVVQAMFWWLTTPNTNLDELDQLLTSH